MRKMHRWMGTILGLFMAIMAITGLLLQFEELEESGEREGRERPTAMAQAAEVPELSGQAALIDPAGSITKAQKLLAEKGITTPMTAATVSQQNGDVIVTIHNLGSTDAQSVNLTKGTVGAAAPMETRQSAREEHEAEEGDERGEQGGEGGEGDEGGFDAEHFIKALHTGAIAGPAGHIFGIILSLGLLFFTVSGLWMWVQMFRARSRGGRSGLFW